MQQKLTVVPQGGLCNRLRLLFSIMEAEAFGARNISIHWAKNAECRAWFEELFETVDTENLRVVHRKWWAIPIRRQNLWVPGFIRGLMGYGRKYVNYLPESDEAFKSLLQRQRRIYISSGFSLCEYSQQTMSRLKPLPALRRRIDELVARCGERAIGVHIRRTDNVVSMQHSTPDGFRRAMWRAIQQHPEARFFLATDDAVLKAELLSEFGERIVTQQTEVRRDTVEGMRDAVVDLWCLAATQRIIGSYWSSFTDIAAEFGGISAEIVMD